MTIHTSGQIPIISVARSRNALHNVTTKHGGVAMVTKALSDAVENHEEIVVISRLK
jgi:hypothetical protein